MVKNIFYVDEEFTIINQEIKKTFHSINEIIFLPYIMGVNTPEYNVNARGVYYGL